MKSYEEFIEKSIYGDFQQSKEWASVKELWEQVVLTYKDESNEVSACMSILIRKIPLFGYFMYVPRGPIGDIENEKTMRYFKTKIDELQNKYHAFAIIIEPNIEDNNERFKEIVTSLGFSINNRAMNFSEAIQARHNFRINLKDKSSDDIFNQFSKKTRYNIRLSIKKGIIIKQFGEEGIDDFYKLMEITGKRDCFGIRKKEYFEKIMSSFKDKSKIYIAYYNDIPLAGALMITYGKTMTYLYGASSNEYRNYMPTYLLQWTMIQNAINVGCFVYDFRGVSMEEGDTGGLYRFKKGFGGSFVELIGEVYIPFKPIKYKLFKSARKILCKIRHMKIILKNFLH